ncbi:MAG: Homoserine O-acetyltransferase [uncultured Nocardioidaceae bacterium]|uniref:Homoserine O-acetyltransferase n=1 Tax=uncultured Nocardioidaceae bacterium TaxID=253824 RepID=A0A6J4MX65_9ACTN|nr:MAG: Homoserine O-acetyltransferase [uncultured Nocardioidaceae bacterium]
MRPDLDVVAGLVPTGSRVLDLGCGDGELLDHLFHESGCTGTGVEIEDRAVVRAIRRGVPVIELDVDTELSELADDSYDVVVLSRTLQALRRPADVLAEIRRIGRRCVVSVPNFGLWKHRASLVVRGRMPVSRELPYPWFETPNIHLSTLPDLEELFAARDWTVETRLLLDERGRRLANERLANLRAGAAVYLLSR